MNPKDIAKRIWNMIDTFTRRMYTFSLGRVIRVYDDGTCDVELKTQDTTKPVVLLVRVPVLSLIGGSNYILPPIQKYDVVVVGFTKYPLKPALSDPEIRKKKLSKQPAFRPEHAFIVGGFPGGALPDKTFKIGSDLYDFDFIGANRLWSDTATRGVPGGVPRCVGWEVDSGVIDRIYGTWFVPGNYKIGGNIELWIEFFVIGNTAPTDTVVLEIRDVQSKHDMDPHANFGKRDFSQTLTGSPPNNRRVYRVKSTSNFVPLGKFYGWDFYIHRLADIWSGSIWVNGIIVKYPIDQFAYSDNEGVVM